MAVPIDDEGQRRGESRGRRTIGLLTPWTGGTYFGEIMGAVARAAADNDLNLICFSGALLLPPGEEQPGTAAVEQVGPENVDALIVTNLGNRVSVQYMEQYLRRFEMLPRCGFAVAMPGVPNVTVDNARGAREALLHLIEVHKKRRIAMIRGPHVNADAIERYEAYVSTLESCGIMLDPRLVVTGDFRSAAGASAIHQLLERQVTFDALFCANDAMALGALEMLRLRGLQVPDDVPIVAFDDSEQARITTPALTSVRQPLELLARHAVEILRATLDGHPVEQTVEVPTSLVIRGSCGCRPRAYDDLTEPSILPCDEPLAETLAKRRPDIVEECREALRRAPGTPPPGLEQALLDGLFSELVDASGPRLMEKLEPLLLMTVSETVEAANWHELCNILRRHALGCAGSRADLRARLENVFHKARILIGDVAERVERARRFQLAQRLRRVSKAGKALVDSFDLFALVEVMHDEFPALGIRGFWLSLYEGWDKTNPYSRLITARRSAIRVDPPAPGERFLTKQLLPRQLLPESERYALVVEPLYYGRDQLGLCVMEWGAPDEVVYDILREQLSAALEGALLLRRVAEESAQREQAERKQLHHELVLAQRIQQSILPRQLAVKHLEIAAALVSAAEVSGDYYDVLPATGGCFIGFGDVAGHGLRTGLIVLMLQSVIAALAAEGGTESPSAILRVANRVLFENVRRRLGQDEHVTLTLIRYYDDGRLVFAGAHEELLIRRAHAGLIQRISTLGTWLAASPDIADVTEDQTLKLDDGDLLVLYTDGVTDAKNAQGERFGIERLCQMIERAPDQEPEWLRDSLLEAVRTWAVAQEDDIALFVARYHPSAVRVEPALA